MKIKLFGRTILILDSTDRMLLAYALGNEIQNTKYSYAIQSYYVDYLNDIRNKLGYGVYRKEMKSNEKK